MKYTFTNITLCAALSLSGLCSYAQTQNNTPKKDSKFHWGLGYGMDYGMSGIKAEYLPVKYLGAFVGLGYKFKDPSLGVNAGIQLRPLPDAKIQPLVMAMYGYNGIINVKYYTPVDVNKTYYGFSTGIGGELKIGGKEDIRLYLGLWLPFRSKEFKDNYDLIEKNIRNLSDRTLPVGFSIGFNWAL
ncbi:hypothetical protein [Taibaiella lutea]|nr:hypothetical protein [Taibaiella lutea]